MRKLLLGSVLALVAVSASADTQYTMPNSEMMLTPSVGEIGNASVGDSVLDQVQGSKYETLYFKEAQTIGNTRINKGHYKKSMTSDGFVRYETFDSSESGLLTSSSFSSIMAGTNTATPWIYLNSSDNTICLASEWTLKPNTKKCSKLDFESKNLTVPAKDAIQQRLIYNGKSGDKVKIGYREFINSMARPAFNNDVEYDLTESKQIGYKGALIEVTEANNQIIKYKVLKGFK